MFVLLLLLSLLQYGDTFDPGCSFMNGQCQYSVKLGHEGQCDTQTTAATTASASCCAAVQNDVTLMKANMAMMTRQIEELQSTARVNATSPIADELQSVLLEKESQIGNITKQAAAEIARLQNEVDACRKRPGCGGRPLSTTTAIPTATTSAPSGSHFEARVNATSPIADELQSVLLEKESQIGNITKQAAAEIARLQNEVDACRKRPGCGGRPLSTTTAIPTATTSAPINTYYHVTYCDFENTDNCGYNQSSQALSTWYRGEGKLTSLTGPLSDHTLGTPGGVYLYIDTHKSAQWYGPKTVSAIIESPVFTPSPHYCVQFWYNMYGKNIEDLNVYAKVGSGLGYPIWTRSKGNAIEWKMGEVDIGSEYTSRPFHVVFEATSRSYKIRPQSTYRYDPDYYDTLGNIALDDVLVYNTTCKSLPQCPPGSYMRTGNDSRSCYSFHTSAASWITGQVNCKVENALSHLVAINSKEEQDFLVNVIKSNPALTAAGVAGFYTSGNDELIEKTFQWTGSELSRNITYTNWYPGQPNNVAGVQHCLLMEYPNADYQWGDIECNSAHPYICEVDLPKAVHQPGTSQ